jgi:hypothetical protein
MTRKFTAQLSSKELPSDSYMNQEAIFPIKLAQVEFIWSILQQRGWFTVFKTGDTYIAIYKGTKK